MYQPKLGFESQFNTNVILLSSHILSNAIDFYTKPFFYQDSTMFRPHEGARLYTRVLLESQEGRGVGMFAKDAISCGATIVDEVKF